MQVRSLGERRWDRAAAGLLVFLYSVHFFFIGRYSLDIPVVDEWDEWGGWQKGLDWHWVFTPHNEHLIVPTKLQIWLLYRLCQGNQWWGVMLNFLLFGFLLVTLLRCLRHWIPALPMVVACGFSLFLVSTLAYENHAIGFQSQFHFVLLFGLLAVRCLFDERQRWQFLLLGGLFAALAPLSFSSGVVSTASLLLVFAVFKWRRWRAGSRRELLEYLAVLVPAGTGLLIWRSHYAGSGGLLQGGPLVFLGQFANLIGFGFGMTLFSVPLGAFCLLCVVLPFVLLWRRDSRSLPHSFWPLLAVVIGILASAAVIVAGRAGNASTPKISRYGEIVSMLIPVTVGAWYVYLATRDRLRKRLLLFFWLCCLVGFWNDWGTFRYSEGFAQRTAGVECARKYYFEDGPALCLSIYPWVMKEQLDKARQSNLSFYRKLQEGKVYEVIHSHSGP